MCLVDPQQNVAATDVSIFANQFLQDYCIFETLNELDLACRNNGAFVFCRFFGFDGEAMDWLGR